MSGEVGQADFVRNGLGKKVAMRLGTEVIGLDGAVNPGPFSARQNGFSVGERQRFSDVGNGLTEFIWTGSRWAPSTPYVLAREVGSVASQLYQQSGTIAGNTKFGHKDIKIPANLIGVGDRLRLSVHIRKGGTVGASGIICFLGGLNSVSDSSIQTSSFTSTGVECLMQFELSFSTLFNVTTTAIMGSANTYTSSVAFDRTIDSTQDMFISLAITSLTNGDTMGIVSYHVEHLPFKSGDVQLYSGAVAVPAAFAGAHLGNTMYAPNNIPAPTYPYQYARIHDQRGPTNKKVHWSTINTSNGVYDWSELDYMVNYELALGHKIWYTIYGCPTWAAKVSHQSTPDGYGDLGGASAASDPTYYGNFCAALAARYAGKISVYELWNEPDYVGGPYYLDTAAEMVAQVKLGYAAIKAADAAAIVCAPADPTTGSGITTFLNQSDGASGFGRNYCDCASWHPYSRFGWGDSGVLLGQELAQQTATWRAAVTAGGVAGNFPIHISEIGYKSSATDPVLLARTPAQMATWIRRLGVRAATLGWQSVIPYRHDSVHIGNPYLHPEIQAALADLAWLAGQTITSVVSSGDNGALTVTTTTGVRVML